MKLETTTNQCSIALNKAFDKTNHRLTAFIELMNRAIPGNTLRILHAFSAEQCYVSIQRNATT